MHCGIKTAFFGQIADNRRGLERPIVTEQATSAVVRFDDSEKHSKSSGLPGAIGTQYTVDRAFRDGDVDPAHGGLTIEGLGETLGLDR